MKWTSSLCSWKQGKALALATGCTPPTLTPSPPSWRIPPTAGRFQARQTIWSQERVGCRSGVTPGALHHLSQDARDGPGATTPIFVALDGTRWTAPWYSSRPPRGRNGVIMSKFDTFRFCSNLAGALLATRWIEDDLRIVIRKIAVDPPIRVPGLISRILKQFPTRPEFMRFVMYLLIDDPGMNRALNRLAGRPNPPYRRRSRPKRPLVMGQPPPRLAPLAIPPIASETALANWLGISDGKLRWYADLTGRNRKHPAGPLRPYGYRWVPRLRGRPRLVEIPNVGLKRIQRKILDGLLNHIPIHPAAHGFCPGRSIVTNAAPHCGKQVVLRFDLADFFPSVPAARIFRTFRTVGYPEAVARLLTGLCTTQLPRDIWDNRPNPPVDGSDHATWQRFAAPHLPQGAPTSPALANLAAHRLDRRLNRLAALVGADYTRYADDLTFSGEGEFARRTKRFALLVARIVGDEEFTLNFRKTRMMRCSSRQHVTGW